MFVGLRTKYHMVQFVWPLSPRFCYHIGSFFDSLLFLKQGVKPSARGSSYFPAPMNIFLHRTQSVDLNLAESDWLLITAGQDWSLLRLSNVCPWSPCAPCLLFRCVIFLLSAQQALGPSSSIPSLPSSNPHQPLATVSLLSRTPSLYPGGPVACMACSA